MAKKKKRKPFIITVSIIGLFIIIMVLRSVFASEEGVVVELVNPEEREITEIISANGKIQPVTEVKISPDVSGVGDRGGAECHERGFVVENQTGCL